MISYVFLYMVLVIFFTCLSYKEYDCAAKTALVHGLLWPFYLITAFVYIVCEAFGVDGYL